MFYQFSDEFFRHQQDDGSLSANLHEPFHFDSLRKEIDSFAPSNHRNMNWAQNFASSSKDFAHDNTSSLPLNTRLEFEQVFQSVRGIVYVI